jgi:uncharacterized protein (DUF362 family)
MRYFNISDGIVSGSGNDSSNGEFKINGIVDTQNCLKLEIKYK